MKNTANLVGGKGFINSNINAKIKVIINAIEIYCQRVLKTPFLRACNFILIGWFFGRLANQSNHELEIIMIVLIQSLVIMVPLLTLYLLKFYLSHT